MIARQMVGRWGMSEAVGPIAVLPAEGEGPFLPGASATSESTQRLLDEEVHRLIEAAHEEVTRLLADHRDQLESLAQALLKAETLDAARRLRRGRGSGARGRAEPGLIAGARDAAPSAGRQSSRRRSRYSWFWRCSPRTWMAM